MTSRHTGRKLHGGKRPNSSRGRRPSNDRQQDVDLLLTKAAPAFESLYIDEPKLVFANGFTAADARTGLEQAGPMTIGSPTIRVGVIGTATGIDTFRAYLAKADHPILPGFNARGKPFDSLAFPDFPGSQACFRCSFVTEPVLQRGIPDRYFEQALNNSSVSAKLKSVVDLVTDELATLADSDPEPHVVVLVMPPNVERECAAVGSAFRNKHAVLTAGQKLERRLIKKRQTTGQTFLPLDFSDAEPVGETGFWNFHHALKAHSMRLGLPTQLIWEPRLRGSGLTQDPASMAWNLFTALFYKAGNIPWQLQRLTPGTCFVGVSFYKTSPLIGADMQTSLAQVFSGVGEGLVLKGERAVIDKTRDRQPHLDQAGAERLLRQSIALYEQHHHQKPTRVVLHKTSRYWPEELSGFKNALDTCHRYDFLTLERLSTQFMRLGSEPPIRGTVITLAPRNHLIYTSGYVPYLRLYPGMRIPRPLEIVEHYGDSSTESVCQEIMALTKINWNSCNFASGEPITTQFSRTVGHILTELPKGDAMQTKYKFYM
jgi:hypothetical protein